VSVILQYLAIYKYLAFKKLVNKLSLIIIVKDLFISIKLRLPFREVARASGLIINGDRLVLYRPRVISPIRSKKKYLLKSDVFNFPSLFCKHKKRFTFHKIKHFETCAALEET